MNSKRRAELQRKLSMGAVPRPPADLSARIKADIPQYLKVDEERNRFSGSVAFSMRIAASVILLITTAFVTLRLLESEAPQVASVRHASRGKLVPAVTRYEAPVTQTTAAEPQPAADEVRLEIAQDAIPLPTAPTVRRQEQLAEADGVTGGFAEEVGVEERKDEDAEAAAFGARTEPEAIAEVAPAPPAARPAAPVPAPMQVAEALDSNANNSSRDRKAARALTVPAEAPALAPPPPQSLTVTASAPGLVSEAHADELQLRQKSEVFGISVDPNVFNGVKDALQKGKRPPAASVNVDALVNYFAGPPARAPRRVSLEVEASPAPVEAEGDHAVLRFTIDTPRIEVRPRESTPPIATDARVEIEIDKNAVASFRRIGTSTSIAPESMLLHNLSVTGLYQLELRPGLKRTQHVATVRLHYRSVTDGKQHTITRSVRGNDLARDWSRASRRHRLASLGAVWSESLKGASTRFDVAKRAEELATQKPDDSRARELANAASATAGGRK